MNIATRMESFSYAYIHALASQAGFTFCQEPKGMDNVGIDITVKDPNRAYVLPPAQFSAQVKCVRSTKLKTKKGERFYGIKKKYYDSLSQSQPYNTILLIILVVPENPREWIDVNQSITIVKHTCYWFCLQGYSQSGLSHPDSREFIPLKEESLLTPESFPLLMQKIADGEM